MRVVLDTNVWVSGLLWRGPAWRTLRFAEQDVIKLFVATPMLDELVKVLHYAKFHNRLDQLGLSLQDLIAYVTRIASLIEIEEGPAIVIADPDDDVFIWCAIAARAQIVVSGDHHLLELQSYKDIRVLHPQAFVDLVESSQPAPNR